MLHINPAHIAFSAHGVDAIPEEQLVTFENVSQDTPLTFKIEANCSTRYKVVPITGMIPPHASEVISFSLRQGEAPKPSEDRFLVRSTAYITATAPSEEEDHALLPPPRDFWAQKKKQADFVCDKQIIQVIEGDDDAGEEEEAGSRARKESASSPREGEEEYSEYVRSIQAMAKRAEKEKNFALATAWYEFMLPHIPQVQADVDRNLARSDEFDLLVARDEVYKLQNQRRELESSPPPPPPSVTHMALETPHPHSNFRHRRNSSGSASSTSLPRFAAPTEASLAMRRQPATPKSPPSLLHLAKRPQSTPLTMASANIKPYRQQHQTTTMKYVLDVFPMFSAAGATRIVLPGPDLTVREMKDMVLDTLKLNKEYEDLDLFVKDLILSDHWRGSDFGIRPGITRLQMKRKRRSSVKRSQSATSARGTGRQPKREEQEGDEDSFQTNELELKCTQLSHSLTEMTLERDMLLKQLDQMGKEYDVLANKVLKLARDNDQLEIEKMDLARKVFRYENQLGVVAAAIGSGGNSVVATPATSTTMPPSPVNTDIVHTICAIAAPLLFVDYESSEALIGNPVRFASQQQHQDELEFEFDCVLPKASPESIVQQLTPAWFESILLDGEDRTLVVLGETLSGKSLVLEGFASPRASGIYSLICAKLFETLQASGIQDAQVLLQGFQTFQDGHVIDFLDPGTVERVNSAADFERKFPKLLRRKQMDEAGAEVIREGHPSSADSCIVITFEVHQHGQTSAPLVSSLRVIETCGVETMVDNTNTSEQVLVGHIVRGEATVCCILHPALNERTSVLACSAALEIANRFRFA